MVGFYRRFLESPNFSAWFERQRGAAWGWQAAEWATAAAVRGEGADLRGLDEVQIVEAFFELERTLEAATAAARLPNAPPQVLPTQMLASLLKMYEVASWSIRYTRPPCVTLT